MGGYRESDGGSSRVRSTEKRGEPVGARHLMERFGLPGYPGDGGEAVGREHAPYTPEWEPGVGDLGPLEFYGFEEFYATFGDPDARNVVADYYFVAVDGVERSRLELRLWMLHPRWGGSRSVTIRSVKAAELGAVSEYLAASARLHLDNFRWALAANEGNSLPCT